MGELLSQDDLNALLGGSSEEERAVPRKEATIVGDMGSLLSQDDLNALLGGVPESKAAAPREKIATIEMPATENKGESMSQDEIDELLAQFDRGT